jgi:hypothetical protein
MRIDPSAIYHARALWRYQDARGVAHLGHYEGRTDRGGTHVTYYFRDCATGERSLVTGARLRVAHPAPDAHCDVQDTIRAECRR